MTTGNPTHRALTSLLPTLNDALPAPLINLAISLLAQSRAKASTLRPDEEIARGYVCAHLACERLKTKLNLPSIDARPPCPPRIYKKLYAFISQTLPPSTPRKAPQHERQNPVGGTPKRGARTTPSRSSTAVVGNGVFSSPTLSGKRGREAHDGDGVTEDGVPVGVVRMVRRVCRAVDAPGAVPHVYAGVSSILQRVRQGREARGVPDTPSKRTRRSAAASVAGNAAGIGREEVPALVVAITLHVVGRMAGCGVDGEGFRGERRRAVDAVKEVDEGRVQSEEDLLVLVESLLRRAVEDGWLGEDDWWGNVSEGGGVGGLNNDAVEADGGEEAEGPEDENEDVEDGPLPVRTRLKRKLVSGEADGRLQCGLGTMMQDRVDWLSEERRRDFVIWKRDMMRRIEAVERKEEMGKEIGVGSWLDG